MLLRRQSLLVVAALLALVLAGPARAGCRLHETDDALRPLPAALAPAAAKLFGLHGMSAAEVVRGTVVRCLDGREMACNTGANLPCGKANEVAVLPAGNDWCRANPATDFIPAYIAGHDSVYSRRCRDGTPVAAGPKAAVDGRGFFVRYWRVIS